MKALQKSLGFARKNKIRFTCLVVLEIVFFISMLVLLKGYLDSTDGDRERIGKILHETAEAKQGNFDKLASYGDEASIISRKMENAAFRLTIGVMISFNIIYGLFFSVLFRKARLYFFKFIGVNIIAQTLLWLVFDFIVELKASSVKGLVLSEKSIMSALLFAFIACIMYFFVFIYIVELKNEGIRKGIVNSVKLLKKQFWNIFGNYLLVGICFLVILFISLLLMLMTRGFLGFILSLIIGLVVLPLYTAFSKVYFSECIKLK